MIYRTYIYSLLILAILLVYSCMPEKVDPPSSSLIKAVDISFLPQVEQAGIQFLNRQSQAKDALSIFKENDINTIRLRLWHSPNTSFSSFQEVKELSERVREAGMDLWLSVHYSDTWADPGNQDAPNNWTDLDFNTVLDSVYQYTTKIAEELDPEIFQIGNEINNGLIYPHGSRWNQENQFLQILDKASEAIRTVSSDIKIMLHCAGHENASSFYETVENVDYDAIGISYYPFWHGKNLDALSTNLEYLQENYQKELYLAETAYPFTLDFNDWTNNIIGSEDQILPDFPASVSGQYDFINTLIQMMEDINAQGIAYWGAAYVAFDGPNSNAGSSWENQALFGFNNAALKGMEAFRE